MGEVYVVADSDTILGFRLAGVKNTFEADDKNAESVVNELLKKQPIGVLIITQQIKKMLSEKTIKTIELSSKPVVIEIPGKRDIGLPSQSINSMVKKAIGISLK